MDGVFTFTLPKGRLELLIFNVGNDAPNCTANVLATPPALAVSVTACAVLTDEMVAVKLALVAPAGTVTDAGTVTAELLLARPTAIPPPAAAAFSVTVQLSVPAVVIDPLLQLNALSTGTPVPLKLTEVEVPEVELLVSSSAPVAAPAAVGSNCTLSVAVCPGFNVSGKLAPDTVNPVPATVPELMVTAAAPVDDRVTD